MNGNSVPRWVYEDYDGAEKDFSEFLYQAFLERLIEQYKLTSAPPEVMERLKAQAKFNALNRTIEMPDLIQRAQIWQIITARQEGWHRLLPAEYDTVEELLTAILEKSDGQTTYYDIKYILEEVLPALKEIGVPPEKAVAIPFAVSKSRAAVPKLREAVSALRSAVDEDMREQAELTITNIIEGIANPNVSVREFRDNYLYPIEGQRAKVVSPSTSIEYYALRDGTFVVFACLSHSQMEQLKELLRKNNVAVEYKTSVHDLVERIKEIFL